MKQRETDSFCLIPPRIPDCPFNSEIVDYLIPIKRRVRYSLIRIKQNGPEELVFLPKRNSWRVKQEPFLVTPGTLRKQNHHQLMLS